MRVLFTADELLRLTQLTAIAARAMDEIFGVLAAVGDRNDLEWDPKESGTDGQPVRDIVDDYASKPKEITLEAMAEAYGALYAWSAPQALHLNIEPTSQGTYVLASGGVVLTTPFPTIQDAQQAWLTLQPSHGRKTLCQLPELTN